MVKVIRSAGVGMLPPGLVERFTGYLASDGYGENTIRFLVLVLSRLQGWLAGEGLALADLDWLVVGRFIGWSKSAGHRQPGSWKGLMPLVSFLVADGLVAGDRFAIPAPEVGSPEEMTGRFIDYMVAVRGMAASTARTYRWLCLAFLRSHTRSGVVAWDMFTVESLQSFLTGWSASRRVRTVALMASVIRAVLRFAFATSLTAGDLSRRVGKVADRSLTGLVDGVSRADMDRLVDSIDADSRAGARDRAVVMMMTRLGLRAGEVARLRLDDIDWHAGTILLRDPKSRRNLSVPLPVDVGACLVAYLQVRGDGGDCRNVFLRSHAPIGPLTLGGVSNIVFTHAQAAGLGVVRARRLRHGAAMAVIADGGSLLEAGQLLGHAQLITTQIYAKTDAVSLRRLAVEWPGTGDPR